MSIINIASFCDTYDLVDITLIKIIQNGNTPGRLGWGRTQTGKAGAFCFDIGENNKIYVTDPRNARINIYDMELNFLKIINDDENNKCSLANEIRADDLGNIIGLVKPVGLYKIKETGNVLYFKSRSELPEEMIYKSNYF